MSSSDDLLAPAPAQSWTTWFRLLGGLFACSLFVSVGLGIFRVAQPENMRQLDGDDADVGRLGGLAQLAYLIGLLVLWPIATGYSPKRVIQLAVGGLAVLAVVIGLSPNRVALQGVSAVFGLWCCLLWPAVMAWVVAGLPVEQLGRRLGSYNLTWSGGLVVGPLLGGLICEHLGVLPAFLIAAGSMTIAWLAVSAVRAPTPAAAPTVAEPPKSADAKPRSAPDASAAGLGPSDLGALAVVSRLANLAGYLALGMMLWQFPALKKLLAIETTTYGLIQTLVSGATLVGFFWLGRVRFWHFRPEFVLAAQVVLMLAVGSLYWAESAVHMAAAGVVAAVGISATYSASSLHGAATGGRRDRAMAIHEIVLSTGFIIGSTGGGWISQHAPELLDGADARLTYPVFVAVMASLLLVQTLIWLSRRPPTVAEPPLQPVGA